MVKMFRKNVFPKLAILLVLFAYLFTLQGQAGNYFIKGYKNPTNLPSDPPFATSMERGRYAQMQSITKYHSLNVDNYPFFLKPDLAWYNGHYYAAFPPGVAILSIPLYVIGQLVGLNQALSYATTAIISTLTGVVIYFITKKIGLDINARLFAVFVFCLSSAAWAYSVTISAHPFSALILALGFLVALSIQNNKNNLLLLIGIWSLFGVNLFIDYVSMLSFAPILIYGLHKDYSFQYRSGKYDFSFPLDTIYSFAAFVLIFILFVVMNLSMYGKPFALSNTFNLRPLEQAGITIDYNHLSNNIFKQLQYSTRFSIGNLQNGTYQLLISEDRGLFYFSPIYLLAILGFFIAAVKHKWYSLVIFAAVVANVLIYGSFDDPWGGWAFGPRYLIPILPLLAIMTAVAFNAIKKWKIINTITVLLLYFSIGVALLGALTTTAVPPDIEVATQHLPDNFIVNYQYLVSNNISSFIYLTLFKHSMSPITYGVMLYILLVAGITLLLILPNILFYKKNLVRPDETLDSNIVPNIHTIYHNVKNGT